MAGFPNTMIKNIGKAGLVLAAVLLLMKAGTAKADILLTLASVTPSGSDFQYTYDVMLNAQSVMSAAGGGTNTGNAPSNNFFTLYEIQGLVAGSETYGGALGMAGNSAHTEQLAGVTPAGQTPIPPDSGSFPNITTYWTGANVTALNAPVELGTFSFLSTNPLGSTMLSYAGATQDLGLFPAAISNNIAQVAGPGPSSAPVVSEPGTLMLLAIGLPVLGGYCYRRRNA